MGSGEKVEDVQRQESGFSEELKKIKPSQQKKKAAKPIKSSKKPHLTHSKEHNSARKSEKRHNQKINSAY